MPQTLNSSDKTSNIYLSPDLFSAGVEDGEFGTVRALEPVPQNGIYFYEVELLSDELMQIGWSTAEFGLTDGDWNGVGDNRHSIGFDAYRKLIWHKTEHKAEWMPVWRKGDIVGCLIDAPNRNFIFYLNGEEYDVRKMGIDVHFSDAPYYPAASFRNGEYPDSDSDSSDDSHGEGDQDDDDEDFQVRFNFGQNPFRFAPENVEFQKFYD